MSDDGLCDVDWKPSGRPQSTMARSFSLALNELFKIDNSIADLDAAVSEKKRAVSFQTSELEALEARIRATEERLKAAAASKSPSSESSSPNHHQRTSVGDTFAPQQIPAQNPPSPSPAEFNARSRPGTANRPKTGEGRPASAWKQSDVPPMPGQLPPTPGASEGESEPEYVLVERLSGGVASADFGVKDEDASPTKENADDEEL